MVHGVVRLGQLVRRLDISVLIASSATVIGAFVFIEIADEVVDGETGGIDRAMVEWVARLPSTDWLDEIVRDCTALGGLLVLTLVTLATAGYLATRRLWRALTLLLITVGGGIALSLILKGVFQRGRPDIIPHGSHTMTTSFPSGHAMLSTIVWLTLATMLARMESSRLLKVYLILIGLFVSLLVGISRVWLGVHWPTDVLAGWAAGGVWATLCWFLTRHLQHQGTVEPSSAAGTVPGPIDRAAAALDNRGR